jgi:hypothetical protein
MGKTTLAVELILKNILPRVKRCYAVCPSFLNQPALAPLRKVKGAFPSKNVFTKVSDQIFEQIFNQITKEPGPTLLFVDDAAAEASTNKGNKGAFSRLCLTSPHLDLTIVGCFQRLTSCSPALRDNAEGLISFIPTKILDIETIFTEYNPSPTSPKQTRVVQNALQYAWENARFCFIWRYKFSGQIDYYSGFSNKIEFKSQT